MVGWVGCGDVVLVAYWRRRLGLGMVQWEWNWFWLGWVELGCRCLGVEGLTVLDGTRGYLFFSAIFPIPSFCFAFSIPDNSPIFSSHFLIFALDFKAFFVSRTLRS